MPKIDLIAEANGGYELLDSGEGEKLERCGRFVISRPDPQALWPKRFSAREWAAADAIFKRQGEKGAWRTRGGVKPEWKIKCGNLNLILRLSSFKHIGFFPEQMPNWDWLADKIAKADREISVLNLFGYTGVASLAAAKAGAKVCHLDGSKTSLAWARENAALNNLADKPIRWILDDARSFVKKEIRRGNYYDGIIVDPPSFGRGPKMEVWKIEEHFLDFLENCLSLLSKKPLFFLLNGYSAGYSSEVYRFNLEMLEKKFGGVLEWGELLIAEKSGRFLPAGIFSRWSSK